MGQLAERVECLGPPVKGGDNMLKIASDARKAALDMRIVEPGALEHAHSKLNLAADEIAAVHRATAPDRGVQLVFLDLGTPKAIDTPPTDGERAPIIDSDTSDELSLLTDVYADLRRKLIARGIPGHEIRFVHEAKTRDARSRLFQAANDGLARVIVGSTQKLGTGANVQKRLAALHHLDAPWRPMDIEHFVVGTRDSRARQAPLDLPQMSAVQLTAEVVSAHNEWRRQDASRGSTSTAPPPLFRLGPPERASGPCSEIAKQKLRRSRLC